MQSIRFVEAQSVDLIAAKSVILYEMLIGIAARLHVGVDPVVAILIDQ